MAQTAALLVPVGNAALLPCTALLYEGPLVIGEGSAYSLPRPCVGFPAGNGGVAGAAPAEGVA
jgi:hypothetical protein